MRGVNQLPLECVDASDIRPFPVTVRRAVVSNCGGNGKAPILTLLEHTTGINENVAFVVKLAIAVLDVQRPLPLALAPLRIIN